jgi:hypothetical protein
MGQLLAAPIEGWVVRWREMTWCRKGEIKFPRFQSFVYTQFRTVQKDTLPPLAAAGRGRPFGTPSNPNYLLWPIYRIHRTPLHKPPCYVFGFVPCPNAFSSSKTKSP